MYREVILPMPLLWRLDVVTGNHQAGRGGDEGRARYDRDRPIHLQRRPASSREFDFMLSNPPFGA